MRTRLSAALAALLVTITAMTAAAASPPGQVLSHRGQTVAWRGQVPGIAVMGCGEVVTACDHTPLTVRATKGTWITVSVLDHPTAYVRVEHDGELVGNNGTDQGIRAFTTDEPTTTFQQVRTGTVTYDVGVSFPLVGGLEPDYRATARLDGSEFDRAGDCFVGDSGLSAVQAPDDGRVLPLSVRLVATPQDMPEVKEQTGPALVETYARVGVRVRVSYDAMALHDRDRYPYDQVRRKYGGTRPPGVDVVHVITDLWAGGFGNCIGGVAYPERAFSVGSLHYSQGPVRVPGVTAAVIAAHEIGHLLGGQHQMANCAEAIPQQVAQPPSDGSIGPCTVMSPLAVQLSEAFSALERASIRHYVRRYAGG